MIEPSTDIAGEANEGLGGKKTVSECLKWISTARNAATRHWSDSTRAWREYEKDFSEGAIGESASEDGIIHCYPAYYAMSETLSPAMYSRTPQLVTQREFEISDDVANTMCLIVERLGKYLMRTSNFDEVMKSGVGDFIHAAKATNQIIYEAEMIKGRKMLQEIAADGGAPLYADETGQEYTGAVMRDDQGLYGETDEVGEQKIYLGVCPFDEVLHTPNAKTNKEIKQMAYYFTFSKEEAMEKFDKEAMAAYPFKTGTNATGAGSPDDMSRDRKESSTPYMDGWELWCKDSKTVYWVSESYPNGFLKSPAADPYKFKDFFPSPPFIVQNKPRKNMYPRPAYVHLRPTLMQLHSMYFRVFKLIDAVRRRAIVDSDDDVISALNAGDQEFVSAKSLQNIVSKGGLESMIWYVPVQELVAAIGELNSQEEIFQANAQTWFGVPDILRGQSDPIEAMGTQEIKATSAHDRFKVYKKDIQQLARDSIDMMLDLAFGVFSDQKIATLVGYRFFSQEDQQRFPDALNILRSDEERVIRIDIETDSMTFIDQGIKAQRRNLAIKSALGGIKEVSAMRQENPTMALLALKAVILSLEGLDDGKQYQDQLKQIGQEITDAVKNPAPPAPPPPDYEQAKIEIAQREVAVKERAQALAEQLKGNEAQRKLEQAMVDNELALKDIQLKEGALNTKAEEISAAAQTAALKQELEALKASYAQEAERQWLELEKAKFIASAQQADTANIRASNQQMLQAIQAMHDRIAHVEGMDSGEPKLATDINAAMPEMPGVSRRAPRANQPQAPAIHLHVGGEDSQITMTRNADGSLVGKKQMIKKSTTQG